MNPVLNLIKSNIAAVICVLLMIAAPIALWIVGGRMNASVQDEVESRAARITEMSRYEKTRVNIVNPVPGNAPVDETIAVNRRFLDRYEQVLELIRKDADRVREKVLRINRKDRGVLVPELFPQPPMHKRETLPMDMLLAVRQAHEQLLREVGAGSPPPVDQLRDDLAAAKERYLTQMLKPSEAALTEEEREYLTEQLTKTRLSYYADAAKTMTMYASLESLDPPAAGSAPARAEGQAMSDMFEWQWQLWIKQDVLRALHEANEPYGSVVEAPVKRVELVQVFLDAPGASAASAGSAPPTGATGAFGARSGSARRGAGGDEEAAQQRAGAPADPSREIPLDYNASFTGRTTNPLFDVRKVMVVVVADSARIPDVFDALARQNFMTVIDARLEAVDLFATIKDGFYFGNTPVSRLVLVLETIWFRQWTSEFMPPELKQALGIPVVTGGTRG